LRDTQVTVRAKDRSGNEATCAFTVGVRDTTAPQLTCPADVFLQSDELTEVVTFPEATAQDPVSKPALSYSHAPGTAFPRGTTEITVTARDVEGNSATCTFLVTVGAAAAAGAYLVNCECGSTSGGPWAPVLLLLFVAALPRASRARARVRSR
jgi:large repetitive protein